MDDADFFYGLEPRWLTWDRLYMVIVTRDALSGAWIAGQLYDHTAARLQLQQAYLFLGGWVRRKLGQRAVREQEYERMDPLSSDFLNRDRRNFCIFNKQILNITVNRKRSLWAAHSVGTVNVSLATGETKKFILIAGQDPDQVAEMLRRIHPATRIEGTAPAKPLAMEGNPARRRRFYVLCTAAFLFFAGCFAYAAVQRNDPGQWVGAVLNLLGAVYCGVRAAMRPERANALPNERTSAQDSGR